MTGFPWDWVAANMSTPMRCASSLTRSGPTTVMSCAAAVLTDLTSAERRSMGPKLWSL